MIQLTTDEHGVAAITIDRPQRRNALDSVTMDGISKGLTSLESKSDIRALVIRGSGTTFSSGRDLKEAGELTLDQALSQHGAWTDVFRILRRLPFPSVAAVEGFAVAGGFTLAMGCDFVIAERSAQFGAMEMKNGFPAAVCTPLLARLAAPRIGLELALFGELVSAERLFSVGLVNRLADGSDGLDAAVKDYVDRVIALDQSAIRQTLETYRAAETMPLDQSLTMGLHLNQLLDASGSFKRGGAAFAANQAKKTN